MMMTMMKMMAMMNTRYAECSASRRLRLMKHCSACRASSLFHHQVAVMMIIIINAGDDDDDDDQVVRGNESIGVMSTFIASSNRLL